MLKEITSEVVKTDLQTKKVELFQGDEVFTLLADNLFLAEWEALYNACSWSTVFQSKAFVITWYELYRHRYLPIVIKSETDGRLTGLFTLALPQYKTRGKAFITGAGHHEADYQTWLSSPDSSDQFISEAMAVLMKRFPHKDIMLRHVPHLTPLSWADTSPYWRQRCVLYPLSRPLVVMADFTVSRRDRKRVSRLKSISQFEVIRDEATFRASLDDMATYYDFRQGAMFNKNPFRNDPVNKDFLLALFRQQLLHVSVLRSENEVLAAVASLISKKRANLGGINFHSPLYASYSPGYVHFLMLGQQFVEEGIESFDLTPGGDAYKDRLATQHDLVHIMVITNSRSYHIKRHIKKWIFQRITRIGIRTMSLELSLRRQLYLIKERGLVAEIYRKLSSLRHASPVALYYKQLIPAKMLTAVDLQKNNLEHLLAYQMKGAHFTRWEFLEDAMRRFERGEQVYTIADKAKLLGCAWISNSKEEFEKPGITDKISLKDDAVFIQNLYLHPDGLHQLEAFITAVAQKVSDKNDPMPVYLLTDVTAAHTRRALKLSGFISA